MRLINRKFPNDRLADVSTQIRHTYHSYYRTRSGWLFYDEAKNSLTNKKKYFCSLHHCNIDRYDWDNNFSTILMILAVLIFHLYEY